jgi:hypothetical protein
MIIVEYYSLVHWEISCRALIIYVRHVVEALGGKWGRRRTDEQRKGTFLGVVHACVKQEVVG